MTSNTAGHWDHDGDDADDDGFADDAPGVTPATPKVTRWRSLHEVVEGTLDRFARRIDFDAELAVVVAEAFAAGVPTYVVGVAVRNEVSPAIKDGNPDGVNNFAALGELAEAGGTARPGAVKFYDASNQVDLSASLRDVLVDITPCAFTFSYPLAPFLIVEQVTIDGVDYEEVEGEACGDAPGWRYTDTERSGVELCGATCDAYRVVGDVVLGLTCAPP